MHNKVGVGQATVDFLDHVHRQHFAIRLARELQAPWLVPIAMASASTCVSRTKSTA